MPEANSNPQEFKALPGRKSMPYKNRFIAFVALVSFFLPLQKSRADSQTFCTIAPGVLYSQSIRSSGGDPLVINSLKIDMKQAGLRLEPFIAHGTLLPPSPLTPKETVGDFAKDQNAIAAVNGDYFEEPGFPVGLTIQNGQLICDSLPWRTAFGITGDNSVRMGMIVTQAEFDAADGSDRFLDAINRPLSSNQIVLLTPLYSSMAHVSNKATIVTLNNITGTMALGSSITAIAAAPVPGSETAPIAPNSAMLAGSGSGAQWLQAHVKAGDVVKIRFNAYPTPSLAGLPRGVYASRDAFHCVHDDSGIWKNVQQAFSGGPVLVQNGVVNVDWRTEHFTDPSFANDRAPRTAIGVTKNGNILLVTVDGRQSQSKGVTLTDMGNIMVSLGAVQAMNLDGGGSTEMTVGGLYVNSPSDGAPRRVAEALALLSTTSQPTRRVVTMLVTTLQAGQPLKLQLPNTLSATDKESVVWGSPDGKLFVDQNGNVQTTAAGTEEIDALTQSSLIHYPLVITPGPPASLTGSFEKEPNNPPDRNYLAVRVRDRFGNPIPNQMVTIVAPGGEIAANPLKTDSQGLASTEVVWDRKADRHALISTPGVPPVTVR
jgi:uncharacterized protein YigE (DUF2233 family)